MTTPSIEQVKLAKVELEKNIYRLLEKFTADNKVNVSDVRLSVYSTTGFADNKLNTRHFYEVEVKVNL